MEPHALPSHAALLLLVLAAPGAFASAPVDSRVERTRVAAAELAAKRMLPGLRVAVIADGAVVAEIATPDDACGAEPAPVAACAYRIGSVTKGFTSVLALKLATAGKLDLDARIGRYLPRVPPAHAALTTRQLLGHTAGVAHYGRDDYFNLRRFDTVTASLDRFLDQPLVATPGARYSYSSPGYVLAGAVIEAACGRQYLDCLQREVLGPLGLGSVRTESGALAPPGRLAPFLDRGPDGRSFVPARDQDLSDRWPAGGLVASVTDLARFGWAMQFSEAGGFFEAHARAALLQRQPTAAGTSPMGLAWRVGDDHLSNKVVTLAGDAVGGRAVLVIYPERRVVVAMATNLSLARLTPHDAAALAAPWLGAVTVR